ncbi:MAG: electron transfer flavoprotein subunit beta/FixA family protein [Candidatus Melainabacteria bacterium]|nr:electron transfer flavoprotein subunit beta/FixA family protein [Candidatus Melainabacteria bacterium]
MNIIVILRQTPDTETKIKLGSETNKIDTAGITWIINPYDEFAIEKALKIKEQAQSGEVVLFACGPARTEEAIRQGLAMGADRAVFIKDDSLEYVDAYTISKLIASELKKLSFDLVLSGKKLIDLESTQIPIFVAEELGLTHISFVMKFNEVDAANKKIVCDRESEGAHEIIEVQLPALVTCDRGEDYPRYASITGIMKAKKKEIKEIKLENIGELNSRTEIVSMELPPSRKEAKIFEGEVPEKVSALVKALREEAKVI